MYFESLAAALHMDGHGVFVWPVYGLAVLAVAGLLILPRRREKLLLRCIAAQLKRQTPPSAQDIGTQ